MRPSAPPFAYQPSKDCISSVSGARGTRISSAYKACARLIEEKFPPSEWNLYCFQFSDGDNWGEDNEEAFKKAGLPVAE